MTRPAVSIVVPAYRSATTLWDLAARVGAALETDAGHELILVDDACPEGSGAAADAVAAAAEGKVVVLHLQHNVGQHRAVLEGLRVARGEWHAILDADLQDPPEELTRLLERARAGDVDVVFAGRRGRYEAAGRLLTSLIAKRALALLLGLPPDAGLYVVLSDEVRRRILDLEGPEPSVVAMIGCTRARWTSVPVQRHRRLSGDSSYTGGMRLASGIRAVRWGLHHHLHRRRPLTRRDPAR